MSRGAPASLGVPAGHPVEEDSLVAELDPLGLDELVRVRHDVVLGHAHLVLAQQVSHDQHFFPLTRFHYTATIHQSS